MKLWLDDIRPAPDGWTWVTTAPAAIAALEAGGVTSVSLDHDLGDDVNGTGYSVACWIEEAVALRGFVPPEITIHSANVVGRARMARAIESIERLVALRRESAAGLPPEAADSLLVEPEIAFVTKEQIEALLAEARAVGDEPTARIARAALGERNVPGVDARFEHPVDARDECVRLIGTRRLVRSP